MAKHLKTVIKYVFLFVMGISILYLAFRGQDLGRIWQEIKTANFFWVIVSAATVWLAHILRALRWQMLYKSIHYKVRFWNVYHAVIIGYLANLALPRFGEIGRCSVMYKAEKTPMFASIGTVITERLFDVLMLLLSGLAILIFQYSIVSHFLYTTIYLNLLKKAETINLYWILGSGIVILAFIGFIFYLLRKRFSRKFLKILVSLRQGFSSYSRLKEKKLFLIYSASIWFLYFLSMYLSFFAIEATSGLQLNAAYTAFVFSSFAMIAPVQGGIGVFHWMVAQSLVLYAIDFKDALAYATIIHSSQVLLILILGSLSLLLILSKKNNPTVGKED